MPPYDSDSSDDEQDYSTTNVTLGYATTEPTDDEISHIGGHPTWLDSSTAPPASLARCKVCSSYMSLLLQLNADLQQYFPNDERRLHVLCCRKKQCSKKVGSVRAFREVRKAEVKERKEKKQVSESQSAKPTQDLGSALFGSSQQRSTANGANPFSMSSQSTSQAQANPFAAPSSSAQGPVNPFASLGGTSSLAALSPQRPNENVQPPTESFADKLKLNSEPPPSKKDSTPQEPWPSQSSFPPPFPTFNLDAYPEELEKEQPPPTASTSSKQQTQYDDETTNTTTSSKEDFDSAMDKTFQRFSDRISQNPEQVLRYEFKGDPLLYSGGDDVASRFILPHGKAGAPRGIPRCEDCGGQRVFEVQLVPGLIYEVEKNEEISLDEGMEWGTIILATCLNNCGESGTVSFREEWVGVQWEERIVRK